MNCRSLDMKGFRDGNQLFSLLELIQLSYVETLVFSPRILKKLISLVCAHVYEPSSCLNSTDCVSYLKAMPRWFHWPIDATQFQRSCQFCKPLLSFSATFLNLRSQLIHYSFVCLECGSCFGVKSIAEYVCVCGFHSTQIQQKDTVVVVLGPDGCTDSFTCPIWQMDPKPLQWKARANSQPSVWEYPLCSRNLQPLDCFDLFSDSLRNIYQTAWRTGSSNQPLHYRRTMITLKACTGENRNYM